MAGPGSHTGHSALKHGLRFLAVCGFMFVAANNVAAQTPPRDWTVLGHEILAQRQRVQDLHAQEQQVIDAIDRVGFSLDVHKRELDRIKAEADSIEKDLAVISQKVVTLEAEAGLAEERARAGLVNLYKARMRGDLGTLASADSLLNLSLRQKVLNRLLENDYAATQSLATALTGLKTAQAEMTDMQAYKNKKMAEAREKLKEVNAVRAENEKLLKSIAKEKDMQMAALKYMEASSQQLDAQLMQLNAATLHLAPADEKNPAVGSFSASKGLLIMPVKGKITTTFGPYKPPGENVELFRKGVDIQATPESRVSAVFAGTVVYAEWFKGYGNMLIIDHGEGYFTVYARLGKMYKSVNNVVLGGETIGEINSDSGISGSELYFEIRHHAQPQNPTVWLTKNR